MSTRYSWEGIRQVRATLLGARHVRERFCGGYVYLGRYIKCSTFFFTFSYCSFSLHSFPSIPFLLRLVSRDRLGAPVCEGRARTLNVL